MFDIHFLVEDHKLASALTALDGMVLNLEVRPVKHAEAAKNGKVHSTAPLQKGDLGPATHAHLAAGGITHPEPQQIRGAVIAVGGSPKSYSSVITSMVANGLMKRSKLNKSPGQGSRFSYELLGL